MTATKYTPAPWFANGNQIEAKSRLHTIICTTACKANGVPYAARDLDEAKANARLIATAPELLESLQEIARICEAVRYTAGLGKNQLERLEKARVVIAKSTGRAA